jgi:predicted dehydrogenase
MECIGRGLYVNLEKPPSVLIQQLDEMIEYDAAERVSVGFQHISSAQILQLKEWIIQGRLGELCEIRTSASWPRCGSYYERNEWAGKMTLDGKPVYDGPATNAMAHLIEDAMFLAGSTLDGFDEPEGVHAEIYRVRPIESYDLVAIRARFASGVKMVATLTHANECEEPFWIEARGSRDWARISNNGECLESSDGAHAFPPGIELDPFARMHDDFVNFATGETQRARVRLADSRGYMVTTNGALISSGGIHDITRAHFRTYLAAEGEGYHVLGLSRLMERSTAECALFSEMNAPWARETKPVTVRNIKSLNLSSFLPPPAFA